ncbi:MAG: RNA polymerase sigma factor SigZ [Deltaproteobacteria bacterium]
MLNLEDIWQNYRLNLRGYIAKRAPAHAVEDILQDVFLRALENIDTLKSRESLSSWLYRVTANAVADYYRSSRPSEQLPERLPAPDVERDYAAELAACLEPLISHLPEAYRAPIALSELEGLPHREVALRLGISLSGAKSRIQRGRERLRRLLLGCCEVETAPDGGITDYKPRGGGCAVECD